LKRVDPFLATTAKQTTDVARQQILNEQQSNYNRGAVGNGVFYAVRARGLYNEDTIPAVID
jgi:hypothetical protein